MTGSTQDGDRTRDEGPADRDLDREPAMHAPGQGLDAPIDVEPAARPAERDDHPDEDAKPDEDVSTLLKEGAGAPDAADIEDPETQL